MLSTTRQRILAHLLEDGPTHRADLARELGVSRTTITNSVAALVDEGVVDPGDTSTARLKERLSIAVSAGLVGVMTSFAERLQVAVLSANGAILRLHDEPCAALEPGTSRMARLSEILAEQLEQLHVAAAQEGRRIGELLMVHLTVNVQCDRQSGEMVAGRSAAAWAGLNPKVLVEDEFHVPVVIENTARLLGFAQSLAVPGGSASSLVYVHLDRGVSMAQILDGRIIAGTNGAAGELGHLVIDREGLPCTCGNRGCLVRYIGLEVVEEQVRVALGAETDVHAAITDRGDATHPVTAIIERTGVIAGEALTSVCNLLGPQLLIIGGALSHAGDTLLDPLVTELRRRALPATGSRVEVRLAQPLSPEDLAQASARCLLSEPQRVEQLTGLLLGA